MSFLRRLPALRVCSWAQQSGSGSLLQQAAAFSSAQPQPADNGSYAVPEGHQSSDLSDAACNIRLSRRKDLSLREDLRLTVKGEKKTLGELLKVWETPALVGWSQGGTGGGRAHAQCQSWALTSPGCHPAAQLSGLVCASSCCPVSPPLARVSVFPAGPQGGGVWRARLRQGVQRAARAQLPAPPG